MEQNEGFWLRLIYLHSVHNVVVEGTFR